MKPHEIERVYTHPDQMAIVLYLDPDLYWFRGHFSVQPLLPGVTQLTWVMDYARECLAADWHFHSIPNVKFQSLLIPESTITLNIDWQEEREMLSFSYLRHQGDQRLPASSGKIRLCR